MKKLITVAAIIIAGICDLSGQEYIKSDEVIQGVRIVETFPATFIDDYDIYLLSWNYICSPSDNIDHYYLTLYCSQNGNWSIKAGDKIYLGLSLEDEYVELTSLTDEEPKAITIDEVKYSILAKYLLPQDAYNKLFTGFDRFKILARDSYSAPAILDVNMPFEAIEHMMMSYLYIMIATGR
jgi:hypothetical protein